MSRIHPMRKNFAAEVLFKIELLTVAHSWDIFGA